MNLESLLKRLSYLVNSEGNVDDDVDEISQCQACNEGVGPVPHALVLVDDPQKGGVAHNPYDEDGAGNGRVDVPETGRDGRLDLNASRRYAPSGDVFLRPPRAGHTALHRATVALSSGRGGGDGAQGQGLSHSQPLSVGLIHLAHSTACQGRH